MSGSWYTPGIYTPQNREAAYTLSRMAEFGSRPAGDPRPFPIEANPVTRTGQQQRVWMAQPFFSWGQWNPPGWYSPVGGRRKRTLRRKAKKTMRKRKGMTRKN
jgi:hypothetical protein